MKPAVFIPLVLHQNNEFFLGADLSLPQKNQNSRRIVGKNCKTEYVMYS